MTRRWPTERERLGYVCNPRSLKEGTETSRPVATVAVPPLSCRVSGSAPQRKHELMRCTCCLLYSHGDQRQLDAMIACQCPLARLVTLEVDWSLWRDPNFVGHPTWRLRSLLQGTRVTYVTETFPILKCYKIICLALILTDNEMQRHKEQKDKEETQIRSIKTKRKLYLKNSVNLAQWWYTKEHTHI